MDEIGDKTTMAETGDETTTAETGDETCPFCLDTIENPTLHLQEYHRISEEKSLEKLLNCTDFRQLKSLSERNKDRPSDVSAHLRNMVPENKVTKTKISDIRSVFGRYTCRNCPPPVDPQSEETVSFTSRSSAVQHVKDVHQADAAGKTDREISRTFVVRQILKMILVRLDQVP